MPAFQREESIQREERRKCVAEESGASKQRIKASRWLLICTTGTTGPGKTESTKRGRSVNRMEVSVAAREKTKKSCCCVLLVLRDAGPWDLLHEAWMYVRVLVPFFSFFRFFSLSLLWERASEIKEWGGMWEGNGNERHECVCLRWHTPFTFWILCGG